MRSTSLQRLVWQLCQTAQPRQLDHGSDAEFLKCFLNLPRKWGIFFGARTDARGEFKIAGLLAGVRLRADVMTKERALAKLFQNQTFKPGEVRALGDVKVKVMRE